VIVADVNLLAYLLIPSVQTAEAVAVFRQDPEWNVPYLWRSEFRNILVTYMRVRGIAEDDALLAWDHAFALLRPREHEVDPSVVLGLATRLSISAYDAEYVALAGHLRVPLVTFDQKLQATAPGTAISAEAFFTQGT